MLLKLKLKGIHFLDLCINHVNDKLNFPWYCKPTDTGLLMNYHTLAPTSYERSVVESFVHRVYRACSAEKVSSLEKFMMIIQQNQYPTNFYDPIFSNTIEKLVPSKIKRTKKKVSQVKKCSKAKCFRWIKRNSHWSVYKKMKSIGAPLQLVRFLCKMRTWLLSLKSKI